MVVMRRALAAGPRLTGELPEVPYEELNRNYVSAAARSLISEQQLAVLQVSAIIRCCHPRRVTRTDVCISCKSWLVYKPGVWSLHCNSPSILVDIFLCAPSILWLYGVWSNNMSGV